MSGRLAGRGAVLIGGGQTHGLSTGNGRATAQTFAREGATVLVVDRDLESAQRTVELITRDGGAASAVEADVTREPDFGVVERAALTTLPAVDVLVNNVGIVGAGTTEEITREQWQAVLDVNLTGTWLGCKTFLPHMRERGSGSIINISSMAGLLPGGMVIAYSTSKAAINALTRSLALEYAPHGVRVNGVAPGMVDTPMGIDAPAQASGQVRDQLLATRARMTPLSHRGTGWDVAAACLYLASDESAFVTGVVLPVDGGATLGQAPRRSPRNESAN